MSRRITFLGAEWRHLLMANYEAPRELIAPLVPRGTELDTHDDGVLVSVVGFRFLHTRLLGIPVPFHRHFDEVNLRFYVRRVMPDGEVRRGVTFVKEIVPKAAIAAVARLAYNEPYVALPMRSTTPSRDHAAPGERVEYGWRSRGAWEHVAARAAGAPTTPLPGSDASFITEHYWGYTRQRNGGTIEYEVQHPPWRVQVAADTELLADVERLYGPAYVPILARPPVSAFIADGSPVTVLAPSRLV